MEDRTIAGRYRLTDRIGSGGMGVVWRAQDTRLRRVVAVKELLSHTGFDDEATRRAVREGRMAARLQHPNVIALYDVVEHDGHPWLVMEYLPSRSLAAILSERGRLPHEEAQRLGAQLAAGLAAAHRAGVVHRDVKPANVLVTEFGTVKVTDFGTSRAADEVTVTASGMLVGTPAYLSPEVARGAKADFPSDVYGLGATLYAAVEGEPPFGLDSNTIALLHRVAEGKYAPPRHAGPLTPVLERLLDPEPSTRPNMAEAAEMLQEGRVLDPAPTAVLSTPTPPAPTLVEEPVEPEPAGSEPVAPTTAPPAAESSAPESPTPEPLVPAPAPTPEPPAGDSGRRRARIALLAVVVLAVAALAFLLTRNLGDDGQPSGDGTTPTAAATTTSAGEQPPPATSGEPTTTATSQQQTTTTGTTTTTTEQQPPQQPPQQVGPDQAVIDYYGLLPGDQQSAFGRLTDRFKAERNLSFANYQDFWNRMSAVAVSDVRSEGDQVFATVTYTFKDGHTERERHVYSMVNVNGQWAFDSQRGA
ncbi:serine/threonine protein kinase [Saccharothrix coeruleofusca]|uniref:serine/threonine-protein kinase n=1 Tax=Saccharothrix coeruleofusca TaxID=33919 RepID=UPI0027DE20D9|nr:protein kinase [Saccharothrix coeruleofusca]MBP2336203.1 serine/threonine protein kinase [Saccharothrix coeruleofusca]